MLAGDRVVAIAGCLYHEVPEASGAAQACDGIVLTIERPGQSSPLHLQASFDEDRPEVLSVYSQLNLWFPWPFVLVGLAFCSCAEGPECWSLAALFGA